MTIKLLSKDKKREYEKYLDSLGYNNNYDDRYENYNELYGEVDEFPDCCGATILNGFAFRDQHRTKRLPPRDRAEVALNLNRYLQGITPLYIAILNEHQQPLYRGLFKSFGGVCLTKYAVKGNHNVKLYTWLFVKGEGKKSKKKVFG